jgi:hypothetical protein
MANAKHPDSALIDTLTAKVVSERFGLTPQHLYNWRTRGIPLARRIAVAKLCAELGVSTPDGFFEKFEDAA